MITTEKSSSDSVLEAVESFISASAPMTGQYQEPINPGHRIPFQWPPHAIGRDYHVTEKDWRESKEVTFFGEVCTVQIAHTSHGVFGRIKSIWNEAKADSEEKMIELLKEGAKPWFERMDNISDCLGRKERFHGNLSDLSPEDLIRLLYCKDRDVAHSAMIEIDKNASTGLFCQALLRILRDQEHPVRRVAQWCVLDLFEDYSAFCKTEEAQIQAVLSIKDLIWRSKDDYARTVYKAGVVLGGHICTDEAADALLDCINAPHKVGRRSAMHAVFHLAEWQPQFKNRIIEKLNHASENEEEELLRDFAKDMARDIANQSYDHVTEPIFPDEK